MTNKANHSPSNNHINHSLDKWLRLLSCFCPAHLYESIEGDLLEQFEIDSGEVGDKKAKRRFVWNVIKFFRPGILLRHTSLFKFINLMLFMNLLINYLKIALRTMKRHKAITFINITGLAVCMSAGLLIIIFIKTSQSYDKFHPYPERTYRIITSRDNTNLEDWSPVSLSEELLKYPFVEKTLAILTPKPSATVLSGKLEIPVRTAFTETSFFEILGFHLASGHEATALSDPYSAVITEEAAKKLFGTTDPLGKSIEIQRWGIFTVTGVIAHHEERSHIVSEVFISKASLPPLILSKKIACDLSYWESNMDNSTFVLLKSPDDQIMFQQTLDQASERIVLKDKRTDKAPLFHFAPVGLTEIPPNISFTVSGIGWGMSSVEMMAYGSFGLLFVLLAVFNYTNLTVARSFARAREVGVRKITGAVRIQIATQIFVESILVAILALCIAFFIARFIPLTQDMTQGIDFTEFDATLLFYALAFAVFTGFIAGLFPAIILSKVNPLQAMGNLLNTKLFKSMKARNAMIVIQFSISLITLIVVVVLHKQGNYQFTADMGFDRRHILIVPLHTTNYKVLETEIERHASVTSVSSSSSGPFGVGKTSQVAKNEGDDTFPLNYFSIDRRFFTIWEIPLVAGDNFPEQVSQEHEQFIILNESAVRRLALGSPAQVVGKSILVDSVYLQIAGVVKDFHSDSFNSAIKPLIFRFQPKDFKQISIKFQPESSASVERHVKEVWSKFEPDFPMTPIHFDKNFEEEESHGEDVGMIASFLMMAIFVSCLGLFGVVLYAVEVKSKEIAIRKIMGSSVFRLTVFLSRSFFALLLISLCIALPIGYLVSNQILNEFVYKIELGPGIAFIILGITLCLGLITICSQTIRAALASPVRALKNE